MLKTVYVENLDYSYICLPVLIIMLFKSGFAARVVIIILLHLLYHPREYLTFSVLMITNEKVMLFKAVNSNV